MPTIFIALQCCQCSTMQVKQQKKSSNKWTCVVCNEKQSVRKVFAQAFMARDVRSFVQTFNMSRQFADQESFRDQTLDPPPDPIEHQPLSNRKKRNDWSEYIDPEEDKHEDRIEEDEFEPKIVTELPKAVFKKPKLNNFSSELEAEDGEQGYRPVFSRRKPHNSQSVSQDTGPRKNQPTGNLAFKRSVYTAEAEEDMHTDKPPRKQLLTVTRVASKWMSGGEQDVTEDIFTAPLRSQFETDRGTSNLSNNIIQDKNKENADRVPWKCQPSKKRVASKWDDYITEEDDSLQLKTGRECADRTAEWGDDFGTTLYGERVEDDIHPDFL